MLHIFAVLENALHNLKFEKHEVELFVTSALFSILAYFFFSLSGQTWPKTGQQVVVHYTGKKILGPSHLVSTFSITCHGLILWYSVLCAFLATKRCEVQSLARQRQLVISIHAITPV